jgi:hypothetical protein
MADNNPANPVTIFFQGMVGLALLAGLGYGGWVLMDRLAGQDERAAITACQNAVKMQLRSPASAIFPESSDAGYSEPIHLSATDGSWMWNNYVDSQNGFGAMLRSEFFCTVDPTGYAEVVLIGD